VTARSVSIRVIGDNRDEASETFFVNLSSPVHAAILDSQGRGTILDNDPPPNLSINDVTITEGTGTATFANFTVRLSAVSGRSVLVHYATADGTATAGTDYAATSGTLTLAAGTTTRTISVKVLGDANAEASEIFVVNLTGPTNAIIGDNQGQGTIIDNDSSTAVGSPSPTGSTVASPVLLSRISASADSSSVRLSFNAPLDVGVATDPARYAVAVNGQLVTIPSIDYQVSSNSVTIGLPEGVLQVGDQVMVSWIDLRDVQNRSLSGQAGPLAAR
jgi:hypothetical protein